MKWLRAGSALMFATIVAASSFAQTHEDLQKQLNELKATMQSQVQRLEAENAALKAQQAPQTGGLDTEINRLSERMAAATNLRSCASQIRMGGEFRYRAAYIELETFEENQQPPTPGTEGKDDFDGDGFYGDMRTRLNFQYDFGCDVTAFAELQAHSAFGENEDGPFYGWNNGDSFSRPGTVGMYQTWVEIRNLLSSSGLSARIGRQEVVLGNQFQFGNADWYNGVVHDGLRVDWKSNCWGLTLLAMKLNSEDGDFNQFWSYFTDHDDDELYSAYFTLKSIKNMAVDLYWIYINGHGVFAHNSGASLFSGFLYPFQSAYYHTFGARIGGMLNIGCGLDYNVEGAVQTGESEGFDTDGWTVEGELGMTFSKSSHFRIFARGLFAEGPDDGSTGYLINFPNRHSNGGFRARYGIADIFPMTNVASLQVGLHFDPACNWTIGATGIYAIADQDFGFDSDEYGTELDIWAEYRHSANLTFGAGVAFVFLDDLGTALTDLSDDTQFLGYIQARLVF
jgi:hypothetical protein